MFLLLSSGIFGLTACFLKYSASDFKNKIKNNLDIVSIFFSMWTNKRKIKVLYNSELIMSVLQHSFLRLNNLKIKV